MKLDILLFKLRHWEFWPIQVLYAPMMPYWIWLGIKARSLFFFNTANPSIHNGGFAMESKKKIYDLIPEKYYPKTLLISGGMQDGELQKKMVAENFSFPIIAKPDKGQRGVLVKLLNDLQEVRAYHKKYKIDFLIQEYIDFPHEVGIFYYRFPDNGRGHISGIVGKHFLEVTGDGISTIMELMQKVPRYRLQLPVLKGTHRELLQKVLLKNEKYTVVPFGNHCLGSKFVDLSHLIRPELEDAVDRVCQHIPGFYFGRLDVKYNSWEELCRGENFSIIELNGAKSEPTHMYDPKHSIFFAWREIIRHWNLLLQISLLNARRERISHLSVKEGFQMLRDHFAYIKSIS